MMKLEFMTARHDETDVRRRSQEINLPRRSPYFQVFFVSFWEQLADRPRSVPPHSLFLTDDFVAAAVGTRVMRQR